MVDSLGWSLNGLPLSTDNSDKFQPENVDDSSDAVGSLTNATAGIKLFLNVFQDSRMASRSP